MSYVKENRDGTTSAGPILKYEYDEVSCKTDGLKKELHYHRFIKKEIVI